MKKLTVKDKYSRIIFQGNKKECLSYIQNEIDKRLSQNDYLISNGNRIVYYPVVEVKLKKN